MKLCIFGAGYVGSVSAGCFAELGHHVTLVDVSQSKIDLIAKGVAPIIEAGLETLIPRHVASGQLTATCDAEAAFADSDLSLICVGTPSQRNGDLDLSYVGRVCEEIGGLIRDSQKLHTVVIRSTMLPGSMRNLVVPTLERCSGKKAGVDFDVAIYPEFLRESTAVKDFMSPSVTVFGVDNERSLATLRALTDGVDAEEAITDFSTAEAIKYANNAWHAVKITFANEIGNVCKAADIDGQAVMDILCKDRRLNISPAYLRPGFAFGGSCLPKDLRALRYKASSMDVRTPLFDATMTANSLQIDTALDMVEGLGKRDVGLLGLAFKSGTDDLRESPLVTLAERLYGKGYNLSIYDQSVSEASLIGSNLEYISSRFHHLWRLMKENARDVVDGSSVIVLGNRDVTFADAVADIGPDQHVIDLVRVAPDRRSGPNYAGICW